MYKYMYKGIFVEECTKVAKLGKKQKALPNMWH
jgi:hypothetical protein